jgi:hypothetical protein
MGDIPPDLVFVDFRLRPIVFAVVVLAVVLYFVRRLLKPGE